MHNIPSRTKTLAQLLQKRPRISQLKQVHAQVITKALANKATLINSLIHCYLHINDLSSARLLFVDHPLSSPPVLIWNLVIRAYLKHQNSRQPINLFREMVIFGRPFCVFPDDYTFNFVISWCAQKMDIVHGEVIHGMVMRHGYSTNLYVANSLVNMYAVFARMGEAYKVFDEMPVRDVFSWTTLVRGYAKKGEMDTACKFFRAMPAPNEVSWTVIVSGFVGNGQHLEALKYFRQMLSMDGESKVKPNEAVLVCALSACAHLGALDQGCWIDCYVNDNGMTSSNVRTALIDMYSKCGKIDCARKIFCGILCPDVHNFTSMISGLSIHGLGRDGLCVFRRMLDEHVKPNEVTILGVLNGCSHSGLVKEGSSIFYNMESSWGITPKIEHYGSFIDLLGRSGYLEKAFGVVKRMPIEPDIVIWRALLSACRIHRNVGLAERVIYHIEQLNIDGHSGGQVLISNLYASLGRWERVAQVRKRMGGRQNQSDIGRSWIEVNGVIHEFRVAEKMHEQIIEIREKLNEILKQASLAGYVTNTMPVSFDLIEEEKEQAVAWHSEKLAVAFGLLSTKPGSCIRIVKNLRTCEDCHSALKAISKVHNREIIVRDRSRFHSFIGGNCSCNDYW